MNEEYLFAATHGIKEIASHWIKAQDPSSAYIAFWKSLTEEQKDQTDFIDWIDTRPLSNLYHLTKDTKD